MVEFENLLGVERKKQPGYTNSVEGGYVTHVEVEATQKVLRILRESNFSTPGSKRLVQGARKDFMDNAKRVREGRNQNS